jgi:serine/threonine protein kinase
LRGAERDHGLAMDSRTLVTQMQQLGLLPEDGAPRRAFLALYQQHINDVRAFARELLKNDSITAYQANLLLTGKARQLLVGPYLVFERLGEGGMGQVFKARHQRTRRIVALKVIRPERVSNPVAVGRFFREVQAAAQLSHPHVVHAYDADQVDKIYYLAMQYVRGTDLAAHVKQRGPLPIADACKFLNHAAQGLQHIHEHGMVHRDIKPNNLMLALEELPAPIPAAGGVAVRTAPAMLKILDLGLVCLTEGDDRDAKDLTREGAIMGTVDYMAPEQARETRAADIRSDIYSLGCTFYFALTGQVPFPGGTSFEKMLHHQIDEPAPLTRFRPDVPAGLSMILRRMLAKDPADRFQTPADVAAAVAPLLPGKDVPPQAIPIAQEQLPTVSDIASETDEPLLIVDRSRLAYQRTNPWVAVAWWVAVLGMALAAVGLFFILWLLKR